jgi:cysteine-rich repeat protein
MRFVNAFLIVASFGLTLPFLSSANTQYATTTLTLSVCGNALVDSGEQCDVPGETGVYSQTIVGRQCTVSCEWGPYCGDGILQSPQGEQCDDGNNDNGDFCSSICKIEPAGSGGGGSSGGNSGGGGGSSRPIGNTVVNITGNAYPSRTINFILDGSSVGSAQANSQGRFEFSTKSSPGSATLGIWATDVYGTKSITLNSTFDVTQGAVTNLNDLMLPPSIKVTPTNFTPGATLTVTGQAVPNSTVNLYLDKSTTNTVGTAVAKSDGTWSIAYNTSRLSANDHTLRARFITGTPPLTIQSNFSSAAQISAGVGGQATGPADLSRDGKINLIDFSILIFWWGTTGGDSDPKADINGNGRVSLEDFSILLFNWTG